MPASAGRAGSAPVRWGNRLVAPLRALVDSPADLPFGPAVTDSDVAAAPTSAPSFAPPQRPQAQVLEVIIVVSNGALKHIRPCLQSLREHPLTTGGMTVHVVDNASTDGTADVIAAEFPEVELE